MPDVLLLTVGTGNVDKLEETLIRPFEVSFRNGEWSRIILFPSRHTGPNASLLQKRFPGFPIEVRPLRESGLEDDADACFRHFDDQIARLIHDGVGSADITVDITRGTKAMSAALLLAALAHGVGKIRYLCGGERDGQGMVVPGTETPRDISAHWALERRRVNLAQDLLKRGEFAAARRLMPENPAEPGGYLTREMQWIAWASEFWGAWDRFAYKQAAQSGKRFGLPASPPDGFKWMLPSDGQLDLLEKLAGHIPPEASDNALYCRILAADLLANAIRRYLEGQFEEVLVRLYRVLELIGQTRLFEHGFDSARIDPANEKVAGWLREMGQNPDPGPAPLQLPREKAAHFLFYLEKLEQNEDGVRIAEKLRDLSWLDDLEFGVRMRNSSILIHGFKARTPTKESRLLRVMQRIVEFYCGESRDNPGWLESAHFRFLDPVDLPPPLSWA